MLQQTTHGQRAAEHHMRPIHMYFQPAAGGSYCDIDGSILVIDGCSMQQQSIMPAGSSGNMAAFICGDSICQT
jgi:hypothetical protein